MSTFDVRHATGDLLVHLQDESFSPRMRELLDRAVPTLPHTEVSQDRIDYLRKQSADYPRVHLPYHPYGPICVEVVQASTPLNKEAWDILVGVTGALANERR